MKGTRETKELKHGSYQALCEVDFSIKNAQHKRSWWTHIYAANVNNNDNNNNNLWLHWEKEMTNVKNASD